MNLHEAQGMEHAAEDYQDLIDNSHAQIDNLEQQNALLREQQAGLDVMSERYQELQSQIDANEQGILSAKIAQEEWNDAIIDLEIDELRKEQEQIEKNYNAYQKQLNMQRALDDLEKARTQKTKLVYRENQGFVYEQDQDAVKEAQERVNELQHQETLDKIDEAIEALEDLKQDENIYDENGVPITPYASGGVDRQGGFAMLHGSPNHVETIFNAEDGKKLYELVHGTRNLAQELIKGVDTSDFVHQLERVSSGSSVSLSIGDIIIQNSDDANSLAADIVKHLPNALLKEIYRN